MPYADGFELWLKHQRHQGEPISRNHVMKHFKLVKQAVRYCARRGYVAQSPLQYLWLEFEKPGPPVFLFNMELRALKGHWFALASRQRVADIFLFQCYAGFAYVDFASAHPPRAGADRVK